MEKRMLNFDLAIDETDSEEQTAPQVYLESNEMKPDEALEYEENSKINKKLYSVLENLDQRSRDIVESRWLAEEKLTLEDLSKKYGISRERVRQIETESMSKLKENL